MTIILLRVLVVGLAAYRLARALAVDSITEPLRWNVFWRGHADPDGSEAPAVTSRPWAWLYGLISCPFCASWWLALGLYAVWVWDGWTRRDVIAAIATAGVAAILSALDRAAVGD